MGQLVPELDRPGNLESREPLARVRLERIGVGSTVADMRTAYSDGFSIVQAVETDPAGLFDLDAVGLDGGISGATSNTTDSGRVLQLWAGEACSRLFGQS